MFLVSYGKFATKILRMYILLTKREVKAILTELAWSIKDLLYGIKGTEKNDLRTCLFLSTEKETSYMLKRWRMPLYPDWINAENATIWLVTFQIQISNFQIQNHLHAFISLCVCWFLLQKVYFKLVNIFVFFVFHSRWHFWFSCFLVPWRPRNHKKSFYLSRK